MTMRCHLLFAMLCGCTAATSEPHDFDGVDIIVSAQRAVAYIGFTTGWAQQDEHFAQPGGCTSAGDAMTLGTTCFERIAIEDVAFTSQQWPLDPFVGPTFDGDPTLEIDGCGAHVEVALQRRPAPAIANVTTTHDATGNIVAHWDTDAPTTLVDSGNGHGGTSCNQTATAATFAPDTIAASLTPLTAPARTATAFGEVRIWYGDPTGVAF